MKKPQPHRNDDGKFKNIPPAGLKEPSGGSGGRIRGEKSNIGTKPLKPPELDQDAGGGYNPDGTDPQT